MPRAFFRLLAIALLVVAVPAQGMASVVAGQCMAFGHHGNAGSQHHEHDGHKLVADGHDHDADQHADEGKSAHCGPCTACCASASIAAPAALSLLPSASNIKYSFVQPAPPG